MLHCFLLLSNLLCFLQLKKTIHDFFSSNLVKLDLDLDPDPHSEKLLDLDPHKMNADPQPWPEPTKVEPDPKLYNVGSATLVDSPLFGKDTVPYRTLLENNPNFHNIA